MRDYLDTRVPHFHICNGDRAGYPFFQNQANEIREMVIDHVARLAEKEDE